MGPGTLARPQRSAGCRRGPAGGTGLGGPCGASARFPPHCRLRLPPGNGLLGDENFCSPQGRRGGGHPYLQPHLGVLKIKGGHRGRPGSTCPAGCLAGAAAVFLGASRTRASGGRGGQDRVGRGERTG